MKKCTVVLMSAVLTLSFFISCKTAGVKDANYQPYSNAYWGELKKDQNYLYRADSLTAIVDYELNAGSVLLFGATKGDFQEVFVAKPTSPNPKNKVRYYIHRPKHQRLGSYGAKFYERHNAASVETIRTYYTGEKGGCYYINSNGNKVYIDHSYCNSPTTNSYFSSPSPRSNYQSGGGDIHVRGHYRTTKSGKTVYVKPHTRSKH